MKTEMKYEFTLIYYRLIALWVLCEAMLGGIIHGLKIPVSGLIVGSAAVICICLIAWYVPERKAILRATIIVAIFKMLLSPQAPFPAYIAVFFQGLLGELLFFNRKFYRISCLILAVLALLESGLQRILVLTIIYGNDLWRVVNDFVNGLTRQKNFTNYSLLIGAVYVLVHLVTGFCIGLLASLLPAWVKKWNGNQEYHIKYEVSGNKPGVVKKPRRSKTGLIIIWIVLLGLYIQSYFNFGKPLLPPHISLKILLRSLLIVLGWILIAGPLLKAALHSWLKKKQSESGREIQQILELLPSVQQLVKQSWQQAADHKARKKWSTFFKILLVNTFYPEQPDEKKPAGIYILTAPTGSGKTTSLLNWIKNRTDVYGILTPVVEGERVFMNVHSGETFPMEAKNNETKILAIGRYTFSEAAFEKASQLIETDMRKRGWLVLDELGPLELSGKGFYEIGKKVLSQRADKILFVIRDKDDMVKKLQQAFNIPAARLIKDISELND